MRRAANQGRQWRRFAAIASGLIGIAPITIHAAPICPWRVTFINMYAVSAVTRVDNDLFGGISGIDYVPATRQWFMVSDDRSEYAPARFFTATIDLDHKAIRNVALRHSIHFVDSATGAANGVAVDAESMRVDRHQQLLAVGEGDAATHLGPWLQRFDWTGRLLGAIPLPGITDGSPGSTSDGPRPNRSLEGLALVGRNTLWVSLESSLLQDGPPADATHGAEIRLSRLQANGRLQQFVYAIEATQQPAPGKSADNGVSEILAVDQHRLLVLERSGSQQADGHFHFRTRLFCADVRHATDVASLHSLRGQQYTLVKKELMFDFNSVQQAVIDNLEGMSWGPAFADGSRSLLLVSDNNFFVDVPTQFVLLRIQR